MLLIDKLDCAIVAGTRNAVPNTGVALRLGLVAFDSPLDAQVASFAPRDSNHLLPFLACSSDLRSEHDGFWFGRAGCAGLTEDDGARTRILLMEYARSR
jgi:hypothetical protein